MCSPMQKPICLVENVNGSLCVSDSAIEYLSRNNQPVVVVSVVGLYRTGKSYLMNRLAGKETGEFSFNGIFTYWLDFPLKYILGMVATMQAQWFFPWSLGVLDLRQLHPGDPIGSV